MVLSNGTPITGAIFNGCTWQEDYWWVSCIEVENLQRVTGIGDRYMCPVGADISRCKVASISATPYGSSAQDCASCGTFSCSGCVDLYQGSYIQPGRLIVQTTGSALIQVLKKELVSCGLSACSQGEPITGAQGCSWKPQLGSQINLPISDPSKFSPIDTVAVGQSYKYVFSQHLVSCPQQCEPGVDDLSCTVPTNGRYGQTTYNGRTYNYYTAGTQLNVVGCRPSIKTNQCILYNSSFNECLRYGDVQDGQCGTIAVLSAGQCSQNSDCGDTTRYQCSWDSAQLRGTCQPITQQQECYFDYQCTQTAPTCNNRQYGSQKCVSGHCQVVAEQVACCFTTDCAQGYFCNSQFACEPSQVQTPECPAGQCCEGNPSYRDRTCRDMTGGTMNVCCGDGTCAATQAQCGGGNGGGGSGGSTSSDYLAILAMLAAIAVSAILIIKRRRR